MRNTLRSFKCFFKSDEPAWCEKRRHLANSLRERELIFNQQLQHFYDNSPVFKPLVKKITLFFNNPTSYFSKNSPTLFSFFDNCSTRVKTNYSIENFTDLRGRYSYLTKNYPQLKLYVSVLFSSVYHLFFIFKLFKLGYVDLSMIFLTLVGLLSKYFYKEWSFSLTSTSQQVYSYRLSIIPVFLFSFFLNLLEFVYLFNFNLFFNC